MKRLFVPLIDNGMGLVRSSYAFSLLAGFSARNMEIDRISYPYPDGACNLITQNFLESTCEEMIVIDTDIIFSRQHIDWLLEHDEPLVFGLYPKKEVGLVYPVEPLPENPEPFDGGGGPLCEVARTARGFMRVHRSVFETLKSHVPQYRCAQTGRETYQFWKTLMGGHSEDFAFCDLWRSVGGRILIDKRICAQHEGTASYPIPETF